MYAGQQLDPKPAQFEPKYLVKGLTPGKRKVMEHMDWQKTAASPGEGCDIGAGQSPCQAEISPNGKNNNASSDFLRTSFMVKEQQLEDFFH